jgi:site-specific DNA recombinase
MSIRAVIYARSSTRAQMERQTTRYQVEACREYANARGHDVIAELIDESVSGTVRMAERVAGSELLEITATRRCEVVLVFRFDRIARSSADLIATGRILRESGVGLWSVAESVWLSEVSAYSIGGFAERELDAISQRMSVGRDLVAREGRWVGGPVPFGYDLDDRGALVPSQREVAGMTESALARSVFERIASGSSTVAEARRLDELGVFPGRRYSERDIILSGGRWLPSRINQMVKNSLYLGRHVFRSRHGAIERDFPPLVESELWSRTQAALITNRGVPSGFARRAYLLRGLVRCANCGCRFAGTPSSSGGRRDYYYRCNGRVAAMYPDPSERCRSKFLPADLLEALVWQACVARDPTIVGVEDPGAQRSAVEGIVRRITVQTVRTGSTRVASITIDYTDGSQSHEFLGRRRRRRR